jgi:plasmid stabilization system protein ParE
MFEIRWSRSANDELTRIWTASDSNRRAAITRSVATIEKRLASNPMTWGESREHLSRRVVHQPPVGIDIHIEESSRIVKVVRIWDYKKVDGRRLWTGGRIALILLASASLLLDCCRRRPNNRRSLGPLGQRRLLHRVHRLLRHPVGEGLQRTHAVAVRVGRLEARLLGD